MSRIIYQENKEGIDLIVPSGTQPSIRRRGNAMRRIRIAETLILLICLIFAQQVSAAVIYVNDDAPGPGHDGSSWQTAYLDLQQALDEAQWGDDIWVAAGVYKPSQLAHPDAPRTAHYSLINGVGIYGGFAGTEDPASFGLDDRDFELNETILTGDLNDNGRDPNDCYHIFYNGSTDNLDPNAILDGFTITGGNADASEQACMTPNNEGGGIYNYQSSPVITNCKFVDNYAKSFDTNYGFGGGIYNYESDTIITNCTFIENTSGSGGGIYNEYGQPIIDNCCFNDNHAGAGGGIKNLFSSAIITNCTFSENSAIGGGAIAVSSETSYIANCRFENNRAYGGWWSGDIGVGPAPGGGAICAWASGLTIVDCVFIANKVQYGNWFFGGGICTLHGSSPTIINCLFVGNKARGDSFQHGGGMYNSGSDPTLINCVFTGNSACSIYEEYHEGRGGGIYNFSGDMTLINCTLTGNWVGWSGRGSAMYNYRGNITVTNSIIGWNYVHEQHEHEDEVYIPKPWDSFISEETTPNISRSNIFGCGGSDYWDPDFGNDLGGNIDEVPNFIDADGSDDIFGTEDDNVSLMTGSPSIDAGNNSALPGDIITDVLGNNRFFDDPNTTDTGSGSPPIVDMGACEYDGSWQQPQGTIIYVDDDAAGTNDGSCWEDAFNDLQDALDTAVYGDDIRVAKGTYIPTERIVFYDGNTAVFRLSNGVKLLGGFAGTENPDTFDIDNRDFVENEAILSGEGYLFNILYNDVSLALNRTALLDGFTITAVYRTAMLNEASSPTLRNCTFKGSGEYSSSAIYNYYNSSLITECTFTENLVYYNNGSSYPGGTIQNESSSPLISNCLFSNNFAYGSGGAIYNYSRHPYKPLTITNCAFINNQATSGGAIRSDNIPETKILECLFNGNEASFSGAVSIGSANAEIRNCTFSNNLANYGSVAYIGLANFTMTNCILWDNVALNEESSQVQLYSSSIAIDYCDIEGAESAIIILDEESTLDWGTGNIDADPLFADDDNLRLLLGSPCIDAGDNSAVPVDTTTDIQGWERFLDDPHRADTGAGSSPIVDMGAYERDHRDINSDGMFNLSDLAALSANWLSIDCGPCDGANLNTDTEINLTDLLILTETYLR